MMRGAQRFGLVFTALQVPSDAICSTSWTIEWRNFGARMRLNDFAKANPSEVARNCLT
jgi:hypothetical protein